MLALYRSGRPAEALVAYERARRALAREVGAEPGAGLRELHHQMLAADPVLNGAPAPVTAQAAAELLPPHAAVGAGQAVPRQLPPAVAHFIGRVKELASLTELLDRPGEKAPGTVVISVIGGTAGAGKTALAVRWAYQVAERFPDGQLYVNLRGYDPAQPLPATDALARFLSALGVGGQDIPQEEDERAARYRGGRLDLLDAGGDTRTAVRAVFSWSYRHLDTSTARAFRLAGLHPGADFDSYAVAALTGGRLEQGRRALDAMARAHLIQQARPGRYSMHDLLRAYACELAAANDADDGQHAALTRLFDYYLHAAGAAMDTLHPAERNRHPRISPPATPAPPRGDFAAARAWLDAERAILVAVTVYAARHGWLSHATRLAATVFRYLDAGSHYPEAVTIHTHARAAARRAGDCAAEAIALNHLAGPQRRQGRYQEAISKYRQALALFRQAGDRTGQAHALGNLGNACADQGRYQAATSFHEQALNLYRQIGDRAGEARTLGNLGYIEQRQGRHEQAAGHHRQSLALALQIGNRTTECVALINLGTVALRQGSYQRAAGHLRRALALCRETGYRFFEAEALTRIGDVCLRQGRTREAAGHLETALALYREIGNRPCPGAAASAELTAVVTHPPGRLPA